MIELKQRIEYFEEVFFWWILIFNKLGRCSFVARTMKMFSSRYGFFIKKLFKYFTNESLLKVKLIVHKYAF